MEDENKKEPEVVSLSSKSLSQATYDPSDGSTTIDFTDGKSVTYKTLPKEMFDALVTAPSAGNFYNTSIRKQYA